PSSCLRLCPSLAFRPDAGEAAGAPERVAAAVTVSRCAPLISLAPTPRPLRPLRCALLLCGELARPPALPSEFPSRRSSRAPRSLLRSDGSRSGATDPGEGPGDEPAERGEPVFDEAHGRW